MAPEELNNFLLIAEELKVKGLTQGGESGGGGQKRSKSPSTRPSSSVPAKRPRQLQPEMQRHDEEDDIEEVLPVKTEPSSSFTDNNLQHGQHLVNYDDNYEAGGEFGQYDDQQEYDASLVDYNQAGADGNKGTIIYKKLNFVASHWHL